TLSLICMPLSLYVVFNLAPQSLRISSGTTMSQSSLRGSFEACKEANTPAQYSRSGGCKQLQKHSHAKSREGLSMLYLLASGFIDGNNSPHLTLSKLS
ncbi:MAG: hypothetical protein NWR95_03625, partial [Gammaproteobacteria bacterium]|nr:hypothetical protein [Gammaproteobacteria bacterium]